MLWRGAGIRPNEYQTRLGADVSIERGDVSAKKKYE
jgi:hypothetical protein